MNDLRRYFEAGYPFGLLFEHLREILRKDPPPPPTEVQQTGEVEWSRFKSDMAKKQKPFYTREQIIKESIPPFINYLGNNIDLVCSTTENTGRGRWR